MSFEQCISVIHYKSTSLWWCITQRMGTSGKNESRNRFSVISFIWESKPEYCYLKRWSAWPQTTFNTKAHNTLAGTTKTKPRLSPSLQWGQPSPCCSVRDGHHEAWWSREDSTHEHMCEHIWMSTKVWGGGGTKCIQQEGWHRQENPLSLFKNFFTFSELFHGIHPIPTQNRLEYEELCWHWLGAILSFCLINLPFKQPEVSSWSGLTLALVPPASLEPWAGDTFLENEISMLWWQPKSEYLTE